MSSIYGEKTAKNWQLRLDYEVVSQSVANNTSTIDLSLYVYDGTGVSYNEYPNETYYTLGMLGDETPVYKPYRYNSVGWYKLGDRRVVVTHNADGTKTVTLSGGWVSEVVSPYTPASLSVSGNVTLPAIARASTLTVPSTMKMGTEQTFTITRQDNSFTHALSYNFLGETGNIPVNDTTPKWTPSEDLASRITTSTSGALTLTLVTYSGTTEIGRNVYNKTLYVPDDMKPTATIDSVSVVNTNGTVAGWGIALQGYSQIGWSVSGEGASDSTITGYEITIDGKTYTTETGTSDILQGTNGKVSVRVQDSRGRWSNAAEDISINVTPYSTPSISNSVVRRCDVNGEEKTNGTYLRVLCMAAFSSIMVGGVEKNPVNIKAKWKPASGSWGTEVSIANGQPEILGQGNIAVTSSYEVLISVSDNLSDGIPILHTIPAGAVAMNIKDGGAGVAFGKYAEHDKALELPGDWNIRFGDKTLLELVYPVGSIYMSVSSVDPAGLFGGTWVRIKDRFLLSAGDTYTAGDTGGAATVTLTKEQMPTHNHGAKSLTGAAGDIMTDAVDGRWSTSGIISSANPGRTRDFSGISGASGLRGIEVNATHTHNDEGGGLAHNNMPPYLVVYVWERTA